MTIKELENLKSGDKVRIKNSNVDWEVIETFSDECYRSYRGYYIVCVLYPETEEQEKALKEAKSNSVGVAIYARRGYFLPYIERIFHYKYVKKAPKKVKVRRVF
jgi:hypothetical protein